MGNLTLQVIILSIQSWLWKFTKGYPYSLRDQCKYTKLVYESLLKIIGTLNL